MSTNDINQIKKLLTESKPKDVRVVYVNSLDKNSHKNYGRLIDGFMKSGGDYVITVVRR